MGGIQVLLRAIMSVAALAFFLSGAQAQGLSERPITIVVPYTAGTGIDICARVLGEELQRRWAQPVVIENKPGASGNIGTTYAAGRPADGHTLLMVANTFVTNVSLFKAISYDPQKTFVPIALVATGALALAVNPKTGFDTVEALVSAAKTGAKKLTYASPGRGTPQHLSMELFKQRTAADLTHVPYSGSAGAVRDLVGGHVDAMFLPVHTVLPLARSGEVKVLAVASAERSKTMPDKPTLAEGGIGDSDVDLWYALLSPAGTDEAVVSRINAELNTILSTPAIRKQLAEQGLEPRGGTTAALERLVAQDQARWAEVIRKAGIVAE